MSTEASHGGQGGYGRTVQLGVKRAFDVLASLAVLTLGLPVFAVSALLVRLSSPGPVFFVQERAGLGGRPFRMLKFRTMRLAPPGEQALTWTADEAARVTRIGSFMRDYGLDELPQIINILRGDMSVVGPRPPLVAQARGYEPWQQRMFDMRPGVLSLAAVRGRRSISPEERIAYHVRYVETWSLLLDLYVLWKGAFVVLGRSDARDVLPASTLPDAEPAPDRS